MDSRSMLEEARNRVQKQSRGLWRGPSPGPRRIGQSNLRNAHPGLTEDVIEPKVAAASCVVPRCPILMTETMESEYSRICVLHS